ncbi:MAG: MurR/RpiR family transcriptional regulator [Actinobacteria bacterium]|nr:MurR/RpiR family transcriptional regulator [Actinomycetota bacterium]
MAESLTGFFAGFRLTPAQRRIAQTFVENASEAAYLSSNQVAALAGVSQPSVARLAVALGFSGYPEFRQHLRLLVDANATVEPKEDLNEYESAVAGEIDNLQVLMHEVADREPLREAGRRLLGSEPLLVVGLRSCSGLANYFAALARRIHDDVRVLDCAGSVLSERVEVAADAGASAALVLALPRYPRELLQAMKWIRSRGIHLVAITDPPRSPVAEQADYVLPVAVGTRFIFDSHAAPTVAINLLLQAMCDADPVRTQRRLDRFEEHARAHRFFVK